MNQAPTAPNFDPARSEWAAHYVKAKVKACWHNALTALSFGSFREAARYVEGWIVTAPGLPIEHGWLELDGLVIDPTLADRPPMAYFPGLVLTAADIDEAADKWRGKDGSLTLPLARHYGQGGFAAPGYRAAFDAAWQFAKAHSSAERDEAAD